MNKFLPAIMQTLGAFLAGVAACWLWFYFSTPGLELVRRLESTEVQAIAGDDATIDTALDAYRNQLIGAGIDCKFEICTSMRRDYATGYHYARQNALWALWSLGTTFHFRPLPVNDHIIVLLPDKGKTPPAATPAGG